MGSLSMTILSKKKQSPSFSRYQKLRMRSQELFQLQWRRFTHLLLLQAFVGNQSCCAFSSSQLYHSQKTTFCNSPTYSEASAFLLSLCNWPWALTDMGMSAKKDVLFRDGNSQWLKFPSLLIECSWDMLLPYVSDGSETAWLPQGHLHVFSDWGYPMFLLLHWFMYSTSSYYKFLLNFMLLKLIITEHIMCSRYIVWI